MSLKRFSLFIFVIASLVCILRPGHGIATASERETELFNKGYEYLFSYKPDKAAETFRIFLKEFPESSARDAAMFWLGKTLTSMKLYNEAELTFQTMQKEFPDSPFIVFLDIELEEIAKVRSTESVTAAKAASEPQKNIVSKEAKDDKKSREIDRNLTQILTDKEKTESLLEEERKANREQMLRIADLESRDFLLKKQNAELEAQVRVLADIEKSLKESRDEKKRLIAQIALLSAEKSLSGIDSANTSDPLAPQQKAVVESGEPLRFRLAQLELLSEEQGKELTKAREEQEKLRKLAQEEKKFAAELRADLTRSKDREKADKAPSSEKNPENLTGEVNVFNGQVSELQAENMSLSNRLREMELQAEQRIRDMRIMNAYLTKMMFQMKESPQQKPDTKAIEESERLKTTLEEEKKTAAEFRSQLAGIKEQQARPQTVQNRPSSPQLAPDAVVRIRNRDYSLTQIIDYQTTAALLFRILGAKDPVWRVGDPLNDFIAEELLLQEAARAGIKIDPKKQKEMTESYKLSPAEADYLKKFMTIARYIDSQYVDAPSPHWVEVLSGDYKPGDAASKTVMATDIQKAARDGNSFEEIGKLYPDAVRFLRLTPKEFSTKYKEKIQIIEKLNFLKEETVVIWSDKGYMLIKPVSGRIAFNPFEELATEKKEKLKAFLKQWLAEHRK